MRLLSPHVLLSSKHVHLMPTTKERALDEVTTGHQLGASQRASLFVFPTTTEPVLASPVSRQIDGMENAADVPETSELRATFILFAFVLIIPMLLGFALLGLR
jgi:hypothetical protein